jgi:hypothetical protein
MSAALMEKLTRTGSNIFLKILNKIWKFPKMFKTVDLFIAMAYLCRYIVVVSCKLYPVAKFS